METTLGGDRLGSGNKQKISMRNYERSSHDLSYAWRSSMSAGTLVPFMKELALPGDSFDIDLDAVVMTLPTIGPLFGSYKVQLDVFQIPIRLYNGKLHMNLLGVGRDMSLIKLPQLRLEADSRQTVKNADLDNSQINPSCILSYLDIRGLGMRDGTGAEDPIIKREFNAVPYLGYVDIYKNYYANKQEGIGAVIHNNTSQDYIIAEVKIYGDDTTSNTVTTYPMGTPIETSMSINGGGRLEIEFNPAGDQSEFQGDSIQLWVNGTVYNALDLFSEFENDLDNNIATYTFPKAIPGDIPGIWVISGYTIPPITGDNQPKVELFSLDDIDDMRKNILSFTESEDAYIVNFESGATDLKPYSYLNSWNTIDTSQRYYSILTNQEGLLLKTYQSDLFNNWIDTEWIDGDNGINAITAVSTAGDSFTIDALNLQKKIYDMLNRIAISGGTYDDWLDATYEQSRKWGAESPIYVGGLSKELVFQEVVSTAESNSAQPLGTLAGRGVMTNKHKGGSIKIRIDEPSYIMGIVSLTPRIDYSQGNKWDTNLKTYADFHAPALDEIGFQDLITDQMAWWNTTWEEENNAITFLSAGKQPAWINYMTNVNVTRGNFAKQSEQMFMTLNRRYEHGTPNSTGGVFIKDLTTYIDPSKYNNIFADTRLDAQNFWTQIKVDIFARRLMSARVIPNL